MGEAITATQAVERMTGGTRTDEQIAKDGAKVVLSQIGKLRRQLDQAERATQHVLHTGTARKDDDALWRRVRRAADSLLEGMA